MMIDNEQIEIANENNLLPFDVRVLEPIRTICEKIMSLVRFSYSENPIEALRNKIRHVYDLNQLLLIKELLIFFNSKEFDDMLLKVAHDDVLSFKNNINWLKNHPSSSLLFDEPKKVWADLKLTYETDFKYLVYGNFPDEKELLKTLEMIKKRLLSVDWKIKIVDK